MGAALAVKVSLPAPMAYSTLHPMHQQAGGSKPIPLGITSNGWPSRKW